LKSKPRPLCHVRGNAATMPQRSEKRAAIAGALWTTFLVLCAWEIWTMADGVPGNTVSAVIRRTNTASGGLVAVISLALWVHWFIDWPGSWHTGAMA
jgi:hypothetical protein